MHEWQERHLMLFVNCKVLLMFFWHFSIVIISVVQSGHSQSFLWKYGPLSHSK